MNWPRKYILYCVLVCLALYSVYANANKQALQITDVALSSVTLHQGDKFSIDVVMRASHRLKNLTASFQVKDKSGQVVAVLASDFFTVYPSIENTVHLNFRWADLDIKRSGRMKITSVALKQYPGKEIAKTLATYSRPIAFRVVPVKDEVERMFVSRENSLWWLTEMGRVENAMTHQNGLAGCTMFGGDVETWIRNDHLVSKGTTGLCYWEITGYTVRQLALEYERTGNSHYLKLAQQSAKSIIRYIRDDPRVPLLKGSLPTFLHYDGRPGQWYRDKTVLFDHGQILMGLLELVRVMHKSGFADSELKSYQDAARIIGAFMVRAYDYSGGRMPSYISSKDLKSSAESESTSKVVIGFNLLYQLTRNSKIHQIALNHLNYIKDKQSPYRGSDHHGRSYVAYGFIRGFEDYHDPAYLHEAGQWMEQVALDMDDNGKLIPEGDYSAIPAQNQLIRNGILLWKLTAEPRYREWARLSAQFLTRSAKPWTYRQAVLKLGRFYRESGGLFNNVDSKEVCSWASIFHIDAMYHYLGLTYGHIYLGGDRPISMIGPVNVNRTTNGVEILLHGHPDENIGIYVGKQASIRSIQIDGVEFPYYSEHTARLPPSRGIRTARISFGRSHRPHIKQTNSTILATDLHKQALRIQLKGITGTKGALQIYWPDKRPIVSVNTDILPDTAWSWDSSSGVLVVHYSHDGNKQVFEIAPIH